MSCPELPKWEIHNVEGLEVLLLDPPNKCRPCSKELVCAKKVLERMEAKQ
jgi:hypothetical protein